MINLEEIMKKIENENELEKTTSELKSLGLNDYYIKKAVENGRLEKISRGKYKVLNVEKEKKCYQSFGKFVKAVFKQDFETAYDNLLINYQNKTSDNYIYHMKYYFILLQELLKDKKDFSFLDDVTTIFDTTREDMSYYKHFRDFTEAVLLHDYDKAYQYIKLFKDEERNQKGRNSLSTNLFYNLVCNVNYQAKKEEKLKKLLPRLNSFNSPEITNEALEKLGFDANLINLAKEKSIIEPTTDNKYKIVTVDKRVKNNEAFNKFNDAVLNNKFEESYDYLYACYLNRPDTYSNYHLKLYFTLIEEILKDQMEFKNTTDLTIPSEIVPDEPYKKHFIEFSNAVVEKDFDKAFLSLKIFKHLEKEKNGYISLSTKLFYRLTSYIDYVKRTKIKEEKALQENNALSIEYFKRTQEDIENEKYAEALNNLEFAITYAAAKKKRNLYKIKSIISDYLEIKASQEPLAIKEFDYSNLNNDTNEIFNAALHNRDYQTAYHNIDKMLLYNKNSKTLQLYKTLLHKLIDENKKIQNITAKEKVEKDPTSEQEIIEEIKQVPKTTVKTTKEIDMKILLDLVYERKYEEVKTLLQDQSNSNNQVYETVLDMIRYMDNIRNSNIIRENIHFYKNDLSKIFNRFFEALNHRGYDEAYNLVDDCIEISKKYNDTEKFIIYKYILEDILNLKEEIMKEQSQKEEINKLTKRQKSLLQKKEINEDDIKNIEKVTLEKLELLSNSERNYEKHLLEIIETIKNIDDFNLDFNSFETFTYTEENIVKKFLKAISQGDYLEAYQISKDKDWYRETNKSEYSDYLEIYKKMLSQLNKRLENNSKPVKPTESEAQFKENPLLGQLQTLKLLVKKRKFRTAYQFYIENSLEGVSSELDEMLKLSLPFFYRTIKNEAVNIQNAYKQAQSRGDYDKASDYLNEYQEFIKFNDLDRNIDYHKARIAVGKIEIGTPDFVEKEQLYDTAYYYFQNRQFEKAIEVLDKYISKDNDISPKGYFLRGKSYEWLKRFQDAKIDYEKALSIAPEPNIYHRLGKINYYSGDYEKALECFLEYEARRPNLHDTNLEALSNTYQALGQEELSKKYKKIIKTDSKAS